MIKYIGIKIERIISKMKAAKNSLGLSVDLKLQTVGSHRMFISSQLILT